MVHLRQHIRQCKRKSEKEAAENSVETYLAEIKRQEGIIKQRQEEIHEYEIKLSSLKEVQVNINKEAEEINKRLVALENEKIAVEAARTEMDAANEIVNQLVKDQQELTSSINPRPSQ
uniref:Uncharacterized protein n=1 Tax=Rhabditophanes sp. KR3021 TaxID=114890 RepID=A0AC35TP49_9BILA